MALTLTRELRFGLDDGGTSPADSANGFAGNPALTSFDPFLRISATLTGGVDARTGMLVNIKLLDRIMRQHAVPLLRSAAAARQTPGVAACDLFASLRAHFVPQHLSTLRLALSPYLHMTVHDREPSMVQLSLRFEFSAAHRLHVDVLSEEENWETFGRCNNPNGHGHNYELEVTVAGPLDSSGQVIPVLDLQKIVNKQIIDVFDHKHLNLDCVDFRGLNPTVENIAQVLYRRLKPHIPGPARLAMLRLWETPKTMAEYSEA
jgi:6-pyruvoyltetrahydropterin/6-carboxytetrahydropterin synthase